MSSLPASTLDAVNNAVRAAWTQSFNAAQDNLPWKEVTTDLGRSNKKVLQLDWFGENPEMQDVTNDTLRTGTLRRYNYSITHKIFKAALRVAIGDMETDDMGQMQPRISGLARRAAGHPGRLSFDQIEGTTTAYDGTAWFSDTRTIGASANIDNIITGAGTSAANIESDLALMRARMLRFEDDTGEPMELSPNVLFIPPELSLTFGKVLGPTRTAGGADDQLAVVPPGFGNRWQAGGYTVYEVARLSDTNNWYGMHTGEELNPFVYTWIEQPAIMNTPSRNDTTATEDDMLVYVVRGRYNVGISLPQYAIEVTN